MTGYYSLAISQQAVYLESLARRSLSSWGLAPDALLTLIKNKENAVFKVEDDKGIFVLRIYRCDDGRESELLSELQWMRALRQFGVPIPEIIETESGDLMSKVECSDLLGDRQVVILEWVEGEALGEEGMMDDVSALNDSYHVIGEIAGSLHNQSSNWVPPKAFKRRAWDEQALLGDDPRWGRFWELDALTDSQLILVLSARNKALKNVESLGKEGGGYGLIHADIVLENILLDKSQDIKVLGFDDCGFGWYLYEFGAPLFSHYGKPYYEDIKKSMVEGYKKYRHLSDSDVEMIQDFVVIRVLVTLGWVRDRQESEDVKVMVPWIISLAEKMFSDYVGADYKDS